jgi:hypothetical protein
MSHPVDVDRHRSCPGLTVPTESLAAFLQRTPALTAADERLNRPFGTAAQRECFLKGLRKAGLPEE